MYLKKVVCIITWICVQVCNCKESAPDISSLFRRFIPPFPNDFKNKNPDNLFSENFSNKNLEKLDDNFPTKLEKLGDTLPPTMFREIFSSRNFETFPTTSEKFSETNDLSKLGETILTKMEKYSEEAHVLNNSNIISDHVNVTRFELPLPITGSLLVTTASLLIMGNQSITAVTTSPNVTATASPNVTATASPNVTATNVTATNVTATNVTNAIDKISLIQGSPLVKIHKNITIGNVTHTDESSSNNDQLTTTRIIVNLTNEVKLVNTTVSFVGNLSKTTNSNAGNLSKSPDNFVGNLSNTLGSFTSNLSKPPDFMVNNLSNSKDSLVGNLSKSDTLDAVNLTSSLDSTDSTLMDFEDGSPIETLFPNCGVALLDHRRGKIVGGVVANPRMFPWIVNVLNRHYHICAGTVITETFILTAAHCLVKSNPRHLAVRSFAGFRRAKNVYVNNGFWRMKNDIGLIELVSRFENLPPSCISNLREPPVGTSLMILGWGLTYEKGPPSSELRAAEIQILPKSICERGYKGLYDRDMICAGSTTGIPDTCHGDSGGPLLRAINGVWHQHGIVSFGDGCGRASTPGVYTSVDLHLQWIKNIIEKETPSKI